MSSPQRPSESWVMYPKLPADDGLDALSLKTHKSRNTQKTLADELAEYENRTATLSVSPTKQYVDRNVSTGGASNPKKRVKARIGGRWLRKANTNTDCSLSSQVGLDQHSMTDSPCSVISPVPLSSDITKSKQGGIPAPDLTDQRESNMELSVPKPTFQQVHVYCSTLLIVLLVLGCWILQTLYTFL